MEPELEAEDEWGRPYPGGGQLNALPARQLLLHGHEHPQQTAPLHALYRRCRTASEDMLGNRRRGLRGGFRFQAKSAVLGRRRAIQAHRRGVRLPAFQSLPQSGQHLFNLSASQEQFETRFRSEYCLPL
jgi:hypothetical protein